MSSEGDNSTYDVIVVGAGPLGLSAAYQCAVRSHQRVLVIEHFTSGNDYGSSPGFSRQFRICYSQTNLCHLAIEASKQWDKLMIELKDKTLLNRTGTLWFGDPTVESSEGNIDAAIENLKLYEQDYTELIGKEDIQKSYPFIGGAVDDIDNPKALFVPDGGTVNVPAVIQGLQREIRKSRGSLILDETRVIHIDYSDPKTICVTTNRNRAKYYGNRVILAPGTNINEVLSCLTPSHPKIINNIIYLWSSTYFNLVQSPETDPQTWPTWYFFGQPKEANEDGEPLDANLFYGFPTEAPTPQLARASPAFTSQTSFNFDFYPPAPNEESRPLDQGALQFTSDFVRRSMPDLDPSLVSDTESTCVAGFAITELEEGQEDNSGNIVLDFVPNTDQRIVLTTGGWCMKYVPVIGIILSELALTGSSPKYADDIEPMNIGRGVLVDQPLQKKAKLTSKQRAAIFHKLCF